MSQVWRVREVECAYISVFLQSERWRCQHSSAYVVAVEESRDVCETPSEGFHVK
jgi:hypothetical protein